jgi:hypothetical protein
MKCWEYKDCPTERRDSSPAYPSRFNECRKVTGALCGGVEQGNMGLKIIKCITGLFLVVFLFVSEGYAAEEKKSPPAKESFKLIETEFREWFTGGESMWRVSYFTPFWGRGESKLEYQGVDSFVHMGTVRVRPGLYWLTLEGTMGHGDIDKGEMIDSDMYENWLFGWSGWRDVWSESKSELDGDITIIDAKLSLRVYPWEEKTPYYVDIFAGYNYYRERYHITNGKQTIPAFGAFDGLNSNYEFLWESYPVGLKFNWDVNKEVHPWLYNFAIASSISVGPVKYRGEGIWNLRPDFKHDPSFEHEADQGYALFGDIGLIYQPIRYISFKAGYQFYQFEAQDGTDTTFFADGTEDSTDLDQVKSSRFGPYVSFSLQF